jgi:hypothetical protein
VSTIYGWLPANFLSVYVLPSFSAAAVIAAGLVQHQPVMWILMSAALTIAAIVTAALRWSELAYVRRVEDKVVIGDVKIGIKHGPANSPLRNSAHFPIDFKVTSITSSIADRIPQERQFDRTQFTAAPHATRWFQDHHILIDSPPKGGALEGQLQVKLLYGKTGRLVYSLSASRRVYLYFDDEGKFKGHTAVDSV